MSPEHFCTCKLIHQLGSKERSTSGVSAEKHLCWLCLIRQPCTGKTTAERWAHDTFYVFLDAITALSTSVRMCYAKCDSSERGLQSFVTNHVYCIQKGSKLLLRRHFVPSHQEEVLVLFSLVFFPKWSSVCSESVSVSSVLMWYNNQEAALDVLFWKVI